ncbi:MAG: hypothetical protein P8N61_11485 [Porticoccaceae bacterium]|nr:hypothetical protein [Porticoccaceae bacterium]
MSVLKIIRLVVLAIAVIGAFVAIPEAALIMAVLGLVMGVMADNSNRTYMIVFAVTLATVSGAAGPLPLISGPVSDIMANMSAIMNAAAPDIILNAMKERVMEE